MDRIERVVAEIKERDSQEEFDTLCELISKFKKKGAIRYLLRHYIRTKPESDK